MLGRLFSPRLTAAVWALFAAATSLGYYGRSVSALTPVESVLPSGSPAFAWAVAAVLLVVGALAPVTARWAAVGRVSRTAGIALVGALLAMWAISFATEAVREGSRMWISAKNYSMLAAAAVSSGAVMGRNYAKP